MIKLYAIKRPSISNGLKVTYNKKIEIYEIDYDEKSRKALKISGAKRKVT